MAAPVPMAAVPPAEPAAAAEPPQPPPPAANPRKHVLLACTGSVASIKVPELARQLAAHYEVRVMATERAKTFFTGEELAGVPLYSDEDEWKSWTKRGDPVMHIELRNWADLFLIAPLDANTLAKAAGGLCDNLVTCVIRAWTLGQKPVLFAPAMNTAMYVHPLTAVHVGVLRDTLRFHQIHPVVKRLICGEEGTGAMAEVPTVVRTVQDYLPPL